MHINGMVKAFSSARVSLCEHFLTRRVRALAVRRKIQRTRMAFDQAFLDQLALLSNKGMSTSVAMLW
ncbi:hypothetical protein QP090_18900 [Actinomadura xylanilytica]|nr:hypothetical protein [Actinomadura xylanilytica]